MRCDDRMEDSIVVFSETLASKLLQDFPILFTLVTWASLKQRIERIAAQTLKAPPSSLQNRIHASPSPPGLSAHQFVRLCPTPETKELESPPPKLLASPPLRCDIDPDKEAHQQPARGPSWTRSGTSLFTPKRSRNSSASRFLCDLATGVPLSDDKRTQLWSLKEETECALEDQKTESFSFTKNGSDTLASSLCLTDLRPAIEKVPPHDFDHTRQKPAYQSDDRRGLTYSIPTTVGDSSTTAWATQDIGNTSNHPFVSHYPFLPSSSLHKVSGQPLNEESFWAPMPSSRPIPSLVHESPLDEGRVDAHTSWHPTMQDTAAPFAGSASDSARDLRSLSSQAAAFRRDIDQLLAETPPTPTPLPLTQKNSTQVFCQMLAALREREHNNHQSSSIYRSTYTSTANVRPFSSSPGVSHNRYVRGTASPSFGSPLASRSRRVVSSPQGAGGFADDRERMVFVSWIPKRTRSYNAHEKRRLELELKGKLRECLNIAGVSKVLLFPPKGAHCKIIFQSRNAAADFMARYEGDHGSTQTESWKKDICAAFDIELTERFQPTVVKIEWAQK